MLFELSRSFILRINLPFFLPWKRVEPQTGRMCTVHVCGWFLFGPWTDGRTHRMWIYIFLQNFVRHNYFEKK